MPSLSRREREIMEALYAAGEGDVEDVRTRLMDPPGYDSVRTTLRILEAKGYVRRDATGRRHTFKPVQNRASALKGAWRNLVQTFFHGSYEEAAATLLSASDSGLDEEKLAGLKKDIQRAKQRKRSAKR